MEIFNKPELGFVNAHERAELGKGEREQPVIDGLAEVLQGCIELILGQLPSQKAPEPLNQIQVGTIGRQPHRFELVVMRLPEGR